MLTAGSKLSNTTELGHYVYYSLARYAFLDALILAHVTHGSRVLLPSYLCRDLLAPINRLGAIPLWYHVTPNLSPEEESKNWPIADVVLAVNYFGFPQNLEPFYEYSERTGAVIVEDNAHGYLSKDSSGKWLGCRTGLGLFSFRKTLRLPDGAALWIGPTYDVCNLPEQPKFLGLGYHPSQMIKHHLRNLPTVGELAYRSITRLARGFRKLRTGSEFPLPDPSSEKFIPARPNPCAALLQNLSKCSISTEIVRRRIAYSECAQVGKKLGVLPIHEDLPRNCAPYAYAFRGDESAVRGMQNYALHKGYDLVKWPDLPNEIFGQAPLHYRNIFLVNFQW